MIERISYATDERVSACGDSMAITNKHASTHTHTCIYTLGEEVRFVRQVPKDSALTYCPTLTNLPYHPTFVIDQELGYGQDIK
jgi:hypothetical protein